MKRFSFAIILFLSLMTAVWAETIEVRQGGAQWSNIESDGTIRIHGSIAGKFESDGDVRKNGSIVGKVESDGTIRRKGSIVGRLENDGTLRLNGSIIGRIESDGTIRRNGSLWGKATPCHGFGDYRRIVGLLYFFGDGADFLSR